MCAMRIAMPIAAALALVPSVSAQVISRLSVDASGIEVDSAGIQGNLQSRRVALSSDGAFAAFESNSSNLVANDLNNKFDIFVRDRAAGTTRRVSVFFYEGDDDSIDPDISDDGRIVVYTSFSTNLVFSDTNGCADVVLRDTVLTTKLPISFDSPGTA